jgi:ElaB/YqjD/DUF883 family membrane-anchored ribosome-binding protein
MNAEESVDPAPDQAESPEDGCWGIRSAADAVQRAKAELKKAEEFYQEVRRRAAEQVEAVRKTTVGDVLDGTLDAIRKHPRTGLAVAAAAGFFLGRLFKR